MSSKGAHGTGEESGNTDLGKSDGPDLGVRTARRGNLARNTPPDLGGTSSTSSVAGMSVDTVNSVAMKRAEIFGESKSEPEDKRSKIDDGLSDVSSLVLSPAIVVAATGETSLDARRDESLSSRARLVKSNPKFSAGRGGVGSGGNSVR